MTSKAISARSFGQKISTWKCAVAVRKFIFVVLVSIFFCFGAIETAEAQAAAGKLSVDVTDKRKLITRNINRNLLLRVVKDSSVNQEHFCWLVEVVRKPYRRNSMNLIYANKAGATADRSQICAWQIPEQYFPNERKLKVRGYPYAVKIALINPETEGTESSARFVSGKMEISWTRQP